METVAKGQVYKRGRIWHLDYFENGNRIRETAKTTNKAVAERLLAKKLDEIDQGTYTHIKRTKKIGFSDFVQRYLTIYAKPRPSWRVNKENFFKPLRTFFQNMPLAQITQALVADYRAKRLKDPVRSTQKCPSDNPELSQRFIQPPTVNREMGTLSALLNKAVDEGIISSNPCAKIEKFPEEDRERRRIATPSELAKLLEHCDHPLAEIVMIAALTGMRKAEIQNLKWSDIDEEIGLITIGRTKNGAVKTIPISRGLRELINNSKKYCEHIREKYQDLKKNYLQNDYVFPGSKKPEKPYDFKRPFEAAVKKAKLNSTGVKKQDKFVFHSLRHTSLSNYGMKGIDQKTIMELAGHKTPKMSMRYIKLYVDHKLKAMDEVQKSLLPHLTDTKTDTIEHLDLQHEGSEKARNLF